jgi:D-serine deaminase-like pyridoxal phosphate-dependent protein
MSEDEIQTPCLILDLDALERNIRKMVPWRGEIYCAGKSAPVERSAVFFENMAEAAKEGKKALGHFLEKRAA